MPWISLAGAIVFNAVANVLIKLGAERMHSGAGPLNLGKLAENGWIWAGIGAFGMALLLYTAALRWFPLTVAYPLMTGMGFLLVVSFSVLGFHESYSWGKALGTLSILVGIVLLVR